jgi:hypothetical protein
VNNGVLSSFVLAGRLHVLDRTAGGVRQTARKAAHQWPKEKQKTIDGVQEKSRFLRHVERLGGVLIYQAVEIGG